MATSAMSYQNFYSTSLASSITSGDLSIPLNAAPVGTEGVIVIDPTNSSTREVVYFTSRSGATLTIPGSGGRGADGSTASAHASGTTVIMAPTALMFEGLQDGTALADDSILARHINLTDALNSWIPLGDAPDTVTNNGNRSYDLVFNSANYTTNLSPGMRLLLPRTVTAPTQCADLEAGSSQYYSKTTPNKLTFTDDFTCMGWVKLESYGAQMGIINRRNADTEGWSLSVVASGQVEIIALRIAGNNRAYTSYQSIPLNKWVHIAASMDLSGGAYAIHIDGVLVPGTNVDNGTITALVQGTTALVVGAQKSAGTNPFDGKIAQAAVFSAVLSAATIRSYMSQGLAGSETNLLSAYSFSNSIVDLNTTTPNDLTAVNSAVATNADTPFTQTMTGVTAGTTNYAIITAASFSTNTTLTVQVPEGDTIPTSASGVSAVSYSTQKTPYGFVSDEGKWFIEFWSFVTATTANLSAAAWLIVANQYFTIPIGSFRYGYSGFLQESAGSSGASSAVVCLATAAPANSNYTHPTIAGQYDGAAQFMGGYVAGEAVANNTTATVYSAYSAYQQGNATVTNQLRGDIAATRLYAIPAHL